MLPHVVNSLTDRARHRLDVVVARALRAALDPEMPARHKAVECRACYYLDAARIVGQGFTDWTCAQCEQPQPAWPNTGVPRLCLDCAYRFALCRTCGADEELRSRRKIGVMRRKQRKRPAQSNSPGHSKENR